MILVYSWIEEENAIYVRQCTTHVYSVFVHWLVSDVINWLSAVIPPYKILFEPSPVHVAAGTFCAIDRCLTAKMDYPAIYHTVRIYYPILAAVGITGKRLDLILCLNFPRSELDRTGLTWWIYPALIWLEIIYFLLFNFLMPAFRNRRAGIVGIV